MCHVTHRVDLELGPRALVWDYERTRDGVYCQRTLSATEAAQRQRRLLNHRARVEHPEISDASHESGVLSAVYLAKSVVMRQAANPLLSDKVNVLSKGVTTAEIATPLAHLKNVALDLGGVARMSKRWLTERILSERKLPSVVLPSRSNTYTLRIDAEQVPNPDSRVTLGAERDASGSRRLHVDWRYSDIDVESLTQTSRLFDEALRASGTGRARWSTPTRLQATGGHHIGTTRMASDPASGVVDENCRVHGVANVFVASSSVFPTCSYANPTLTILALALRLGDHRASRDAASSKRGGVE
jgi:choline dehydrogenase-like flavoprotein